MSIKEHRKQGNEITVNQWQMLYKIGAVTACLVILGTILDIIIGTMLGGDLSEIPKTAVERYEQFQSSTLLGLYNLDFLNLITAMLLIPSYLALYGAHRHKEDGYIKLAVFIFVVGTSVFVSNNAALPMLELSNNYIQADTENQKLLLAAAGEALLAKGAHGSAGAFLGFVLLSLANLLLSVGMLRGKVFGRLTSWLGILGATMLLCYLALVTFIPGMENIAMLIAAPGGIFSLLWMILFTNRLFKLKRENR